MRYLEFVDLSSGKTRVVFLLLILCNAQSIWANLPLGEDPIPAWPIVWYQPGDSEESLDVLWPIFNYQRQEEKTRYAIRPFLFSYEYNPPLHYSKIHFVWPLSAFETTADYDKSYVFPIWWHYQSELNNYTVLFPFYWQGEDKRNPQSETSFFHIWPVFGVNHSSIANEYSTLYPFFRFAKNEENQYRQYYFPWPIWGWRQNQDASTVSVLPFYYQGKEDSSKKTFIFPYYWKKSDLGNAQGIFPLWYREIAGDKTSHLLFPLYYQRKHPNGNLFFITPFFAQKESYKDEKTQQMLFPFWYSYEKPSHDLKLLIPLYFSDDRIVDSDNRRYLRFITPLYSDGYYDHEGDLIRDHRVLFPFYFHYSSSYKPIFTETKDHKTLNDDFIVDSFVPFYFHLQNRKQDYSLIFPFYFSSQDISLDKEFRYYFPFYGEYTEGDSTTRRYFLFPLYSHYRSVDGTSSSWDALWPLLHHDKSPTRTHTRVLPFYYQQSDDKADFRAYIPLYFSYQSKPTSQVKKSPKREEVKEKIKTEENNNNEISTRAFLPFYGEYQKGDWYSAKSILGPLYLSSDNMKSKTQRQAILFPMYAWTRNDEKRSSWLIPIYYNRHTQTSQTTLGSFFLLPPYYVNMKWQKPASSSLTKVIDDSTEQLDLDTNETEQYSEFHLWPFYGSRQRGNYYEKSVAWPLFRYGYNTELDMRVSQMLLYYGRKDKDQSMNIFFPLWYSRSSKETKISATPFLHFNEYNIGKDRREWSLLWLIPNSVSLIRGTESPTENSHGVFPFYSYSSRYYEENDATNDGNNYSKSFYFPWPLFKHNISSELTEEFSFLWKFIVYEKSGNTVDKDDSNKQNQLEFRLVWRLFRFHRSNEEKALEVNPFYYHSATNERNYTSYLAGLYSRKKENDGATSHRLFWFINLSH